MRSDPIEALAAYYESQSQIVEVDPSVIVREASRRTRQRVLGGIGGFAVAAALATTLLTIAAQPAMMKENATASAIARYQMIKSGLVENTARAKVER